MPSKPSSSGGGSRKHGDDRRSSKDDRKGGNSSKGSSSKDGSSKGGNSRDDRKSEEPRSETSRGGAASTTGSSHSSRKSKDLYKPIVRDFAPAPSAAPQQPSATSQIISDFASAALSTSRPAPLTLEPPTLAPPIIYESPAEYDSPSTGDELESIGTSELGRPVESRRSTRSRRSGYSASTGDADLESIGTSERDPSRGGRRSVQSRGSQRSGSTTGDSIASVGTSELRGAFEQESASPPRRRPGSDYIDIGYRPPGSVASSHIRAGIQDDLLENDGASLPPASITSDDRVSSLYLPPPELDPAKRSSWLERQPRIVKGLPSAASGEGKGSEKGATGGYGGKSMTGSEIEARIRSMKKAVPSTSAVEADRESGNEAEESGDEAEDSDREGHTWTSSSDFKGATPSQRREFEEMERKFRSLGLALGYDPKHLESISQSGSAKKKKGFIVGPSETESMESSGGGPLYKEYVREAKAIREKRLREGTVAGLKGKPRLFPPHLSHMRPRKRTDEHRTESLAPVAESMTEEDKALLGVIDKQYVSFDEFVRPRVRCESVSSESTNCSSPRLQSSGEQSAESAYKKEEVRRVPRDQLENTAEAIVDYRPTAFIKSPSLEKKKSLDLLSPIAIPKSGKILPKGEYGRIEEQLKDYRQMMTDVIVFAQRFSPESKTGWGALAQAQAKAQAETGEEGHLPQRINYEISDDISRRTCKEVYKFEIVQKYDDFVSKKRGYGASHLKRLAEDDAASGIYIRPDKERYADWLELKLFCKEEEKKAANAIRYQKNSRIEAMKIAAEHGTEFDEGLRLQRKGSAGDFKKFKPDG